MTFQVEQVFAALHPLISIEAERAEFARLVEPITRKRQEVKGKKPATSGGKGLRKPKHRKDGLSADDPGSEQTGKQGN